VKLLLGPLGVDDVEHAPLAIAVLDRVEYLRHAAVERICQQFACVPAPGPPFRCADGEIAKLARVDGPGCQFRHMMDLDVDVHRLLDEGDHIESGNPRRAETRSDVGGAKVDRLHALQGRNVAFINRIEKGRGLGDLQLVADMARQIGVGHLP